jgi:hypothetical protein
MGYFQGFPVAHYLTGQDRKKEVCGDLKKYQNNIHKVQLSNQLLILPFHTKPLLNNEWLHIFILSLTHHKRGSASITCSTQSAYFLGVT